MLMQAPVELDEPVALALSWMLTYLIHSTILVLGVWLICRGVKPLAKRIGPAGENLGWKLALVGGFVTATVQVAAGVTPALGALELETGPKLVEQSVELESQPQRVLEERAVRRVIVDDDRVVMLGAGPRLGAGPLPSVGLGPVEPLGAGVVPPPAAVQATEHASAPLWPKLVLGAWLLGAVVALLRLMQSVVALRRRLKGRSEVLEDPVLESFLTLCRDADVRRKIRLTQSEGIASPIALWRREIVVPQRAVEELSPAAMRSVLAHELAHLERRDPYWLALAAVIEALCFFQPLNRLARRGMQESAELLCDDWAIARTGDGVQFAKSLAELASWSKGTRASVLVAGMISGERPLVRRVRRALDGDPRRFAEGEAPRPTRLLLGLGALSALIMIAPGAVEASPPSKASKDETREHKRARKAKKKAEKAAAEAKQRAAEARQKAERAQREAEQARLEAERAAAEARAQAEAGGPQHLIIRDGDDYLIIDEKGVRMRADGAEVVIIDGKNPRMQVRVHDGEVDLDLDVDADTLESMAEQLLGGGGPFGGGAFPGVPPGVPHGFDVDGWAEGMEAWAEGMEAWGEQFEERFEEHFDENFDEQRARELEQRARELEQQLDVEALEREIERRARELEDARRELERRRRGEAGRTAPGARAPVAPPAVPAVPSVAPVAPVPPAPAPAPAPLIPA